MAAAPSRRILVSIPASSYCEKARWALQAAGIPFIEEPHAPLFVYSSTVPKGGKTVPLLTSSAAVLTDSSDILDECARSAAWLYPTKETKEMELYLDTKFGVHVRRVAYQAVFNDAIDPKLARNLLLGSLEGTYKGSMASCLFPILRFTILRALNVNQASAERSLARIRQIFDQVAERLGSGEIGSRFIMGTKFSAADLTFAAHASLLLIPKECDPVSKWMPEPLETYFAPQTALVFKELRQHKAGQFALYCYQNYRF